MKLTKNFLDPKYNLPELDKVPCKRCRKIPPTEKREKLSSGGIKKSYIDRSSRIDCDGSVGKGQSKNVTYCLRCWEEAVFKK